MGKKRTLLCEISTKRGHGWPLQPPVVSAGAIGFVRPCAKLNFTVQLKKTLKFYFKTKIFRMSKKKKQKRAKPKSQGTMLVSSLCRSLAQLLSLVLSVVVSSQCKMTSKLYHV